MSSRIDRHLRELKASPPGRRFQDLHRRRREARGGGRQPWLAIAGTAVILAGFVFLVIPGPGLLVIAVGLGLIAQELPIVARMLDALELYFRGWFRPGGGARKNLPPPGLAP